MKIHLRSYKWLYVLASTLAAVLGGVLIARAADPYPVPRLIHYEGYLEKDGVPVTAQVQGVFTFFDAPSGGNSFRYPSAGTVALDVTAGKLSVNLGEALALPAWIFDKPDRVYLEVTVDGVALTGRQRILGVPHAVHASEATYFNIKNDLAVSGSANVAGNIGLSNGGPNIMFEDTDGAKYWLYDNWGDLIILYDANGNGAMDDAPHPLYFAGRDATFGGSVSVPNAGISTGGTVQAANLVVTGTDSNVPHRCWWSAATTSGTTATAGCNGDSYPFSGACLSGAGVTLLDSRPICTDAFCLVGPIMWVDYYDSWRCRFSGSPTSGTSEARALCCDY